MKYTVRSEKEVKEILEKKASHMLLARGFGNFEVVKCEEQLSKTSQKPQLYLFLKAWDKDGKEGFIHEYIPLDNSDFDWKLRHLAKAIGHFDLYEKGALEPHHIAGTGGKLNIGISKDKSGQYSDRNNVLDYLDQSPETSSAIDDDIPF